jgi:hypothetical protein
MSTAAEIPTDLRECFTIALRRPVIVPAGSEAWVDRCPGRPRLRRVNLDLLARGQGSDGQSDPVADDEQSAALWHLSNIMAARVWQTFPRIAEIELEVGPAGNWWQVICLPDDVPATFVAMVGIDAHQWGPTVELCRRQYAADVLAAVVPFLRKRDRAEAITGWNRQQTECQAWAQAHGERDR